MARHWRDGEFMKEIRQKQEQTCFGKSFSHTFSFAWNQTNWCQKYIWATEREEHGRHSSSVNATLRYWWTIKITIGLLIFLPIPKGINQLSLMTSPLESRKRSGLKTSGSFQWSLSMCRLYRFAMTIVSCQKNRHTPTLLMKKSFAVSQINIKHYL